MKNITKDARRDAFEAASAAMSYGEGAGIRRRHIENAVQYKSMNIPGYAEAFDSALGRVDMIKAVKSAKRTGQARDISATAGKNIRALARGDKNGMSTSVIVAVSVLAVAHQTGYDKVAIAYTKRKTNDVRSWIRNHI